MVLGIVIVAIALFTVCNYFIARSVLYPPFIFCLIWLGVLPAYASQVVEVDELHTTVLVVLAAGAFLFSLGGAVASLVPRNIVATKLTIGVPVAPSGSPWAQYVTVAFSILGTLFMFKTVLNAAALGGGAGATFLAQARNGGGWNLDAPTYIVYLPEIVIFSAIVFATERRDWLFKIIAIMAFFTAILTTSRGPILQLLCGIVAVSMVQRNKLTFAAAIRFVRIPALFFIGLFVVLVFTTKDLSTTEGSVAYIAMFALISYFVGPTAAFDRVLEHPNIVTAQQNHTFKLPLTILDKLHLISYTPPPLLDEFVGVPFPANVYTGYKFFYTDFGFIGMGICILIIGFVHTLLYRKALTGSKLALYCFAVSMTPLVLFFFDDGYSAPGVHMTAFLIGCIYFGMRHLSVLGPTPQLREVSR